MTRSRKRNWSPGSTGRATERRCIETWLGTASTTLAENADADNQRKPGTLRGQAADFIRKAGGKVRGRTLHYHMLTAAPDRKWDYGYVHAVSSNGLPKRGSSRDWLRRTSD